MQGQSNTDTLCIMVEGQHSFCCKAPGLHRLTVVKDPYCTADLDHILFELRRVPSCASGHICKADVSNMHCLAAPLPVWHSRACSVPLLRVRAQLLALYSVHSGARCKPVDPMAEQLSSTSVARLIRMRKGAWGLSCAAPWRSGVKPAGNNRIHQHLAALCSP